MIPKTATQYEPCRVFQEDEFPVTIVVAHSRTHTKTENAEVEDNTNCHPELEFHLIRHGSSQYLIDGLRYQCGKNSILIMHENEVHAWLIDDYVPETAQERPDKNMCLVFDQQVVAQRPIAHASILRLQSVHQLALTDEQANTAEFLLNEIADECKNKDLHWQGVVVEYIENFLTLLTRATDMQISVPQTKDLQIQEIIEYLEDRFTEKLSLVDVAHRFHLSYSVLSKKFKQHVGLGFREYLIHRRIVAAQKLLEETDLKVAAIAYKVGFDSLTTFNRDFRMLTGVTPIVYRTISETNEDEA